MKYNSSLCAFWPDTPSQCEIVQVVLYISSTIALIGCLMVIAIILICKMYRLFAQRFIMFLSISAFCKTINYYLMEKEGNARCTTQGCLMQFFSWAELLWVCSITINMILVLKGKNPLQYEKYFHLFVWLTSLFWTLVPLFSKSYGLAGFWCWIDRDYTALRLGTWYVPLMLIIGSLFVIYICLLIQAYKLTSLLPEHNDFIENQNRAIFQGEVKPLIAYPIIFLIFSLPLILLRVDDALHPKKSPRFEFMLICVIFSPMIGALNAIAFACFNETFKIFSPGQMKYTVMGLNQSSHVTHNYKVIDLEDVEEEDEGFNDLTDLTYGSVAS